MSPLAVTSSRKLLASTTSPPFVFVCEMSDEFTVLLADVSPNKTFIGTAVCGSVCPKLSITLSNVTVICCMSVTPVRLIVIVLPEIGLLTDVTDASGYTGRAARDVVCESNDDAEIATPATRAAFDARFATERQIDIKVARRAMSLA